MTTNQIATNARAYIYALQEKGIQSHRTDDHLQRAMWCCGEILQFLKDGRIDKANRWMGFVQGVLWAEGIYTIEEMRAHNECPDEPCQCCKEGVRPVRNPI